MSRVQQLRNLGFDESRHIPGTSTWKIRCSACEALVINGTPTHETGCPQKTSECKNCGGIAKGGDQFCDEACARMYYGA